MVELHGLRKLTSLHDAVQHGTVTLRDGDLMQMVLLDHMWEGRGQPHFPASLISSLLPLFRRVMRQIVEACTMEKVPLDEARKDSAR